MMENLGKVSSTLLKDGVVSGCSLVIRETNAMITAGQVFLNGLVYNTPDTNITLTKLGTELIGIKVKQEKVTALEDPSLKDPAQGYENYGLEGADRLKETIEFTVNDNEALTIFLVQDGNLQTNDTQIVNSEFTEVLARRTYDESGNYKLRGLDVVPKGTDNATHITMTLESGKAYIQGYEVVKTASSTFFVEKSVDTRSVLSEPKKYQAEVNQYSLNNSAIKTINKLIAEVQVQENVTRGNVSGGIDFLSKKPVVSIVAITQGGTTYKVNTDFNLLNDGVDWSPSGAEPALGSSYSVTWTYNKVLDPTLDYSLIENNGTHYVQFLDSGDKPVPNSTFHVDYEFYLARKDLICLDYKGVIKIIKGQPDLLRLVESPANYPIDLLRLATVTVAPNSGEVRAIDVSVTRFSMEDLDKFYKRLDQLEYNQAVEDLDNVAIEGEGATNLKGVFTDAFINFNKADTAHADFSAAMDIPNEELTLSANHEFRQPELGGLTTAVKHSRLVTAKYEPTVAINQAFATGSMRINPYLVFPNRPAMKLAPEMDSWVEETKVVIDGGTTVKVLQLRRWWGHLGESWTESERKIWESLGYGDWNSWDAPPDRKYVNTTTKIMDEAIMYMRRKTITFVAESFLPYQDNIEGKFDGLPVTLSPASQIYAGASEGTLKADNRGVVQGNFTIPENIRCGTRELALTPRADLAMLAKAPYTANGRRRSVEETVFTTIVRVEPYDPLAQTFEFEQDRMMKAVDLFFSAKDKENNVTVQIRGTDNGYPNTTVYAEKVLTPADVVVSVDSSKATHVEFADPIYCKAYEQYCIVVLTESAEDALFIATMGELDLLSRAQVVKQPYIAGVLFSSSNAKTWTAHQTQDMKFKIYCCNYDKESIAYFNKLENLSSDRFLVTADSEIPQGCELRWEQKLDNGNWQPMAVYADREFSSLIDSMEIRAIFTTNGLVSPALAFDSIQFVNFRNTTESVYISRNVYHGDTFTKVKQVLDVYSPIGANVVVKFATDTTGTEWQTAERTGEEQITQSYKRLTFEKTLSGAVSNFRARIELSTNDRCSRPRVRRFLNILK